MQIILPIGPQRHVSSTFSQKVESTTRGLKRRHGQHRVTIQVLFFSFFFFPLPPLLSSPTPLQSTPWKRRRVTHGNSFIRIFTNENSRHLRAYEWAPRCSERLVKPHRRRRKENEGKNVRWGDTATTRRERDEKKKKYHFKQRL